MAFREHFIPSEWLELTVSTPALLFPALSLILLAYTNRFLGLMAVIRKLKDEYDHAIPETKNQLRLQIKLLRQRVILIRNMQALGLSGMLCCVFCVFVLFMDWVTAGKICFMLSLSLMLMSMVLSLKEILLSVNAIDVELAEMLDEKSSK